VASRWGTTVGEQGDSLREWNERLAIGEIQLREWNERLLQRAGRECGRTG